MGKRESEFQSKLINKLQAEYPGCIVLKNDPNYIQGIPDIQIVYKKKYAFLECKESKDAKHQPNQDYYIDRINQMSFARFICPENEEEVLNELQQALRPRRSTRVPKR